MAKDLTSPDLAAPATLGQGDPRPHALIVGAGLGGLFSRNAASSGAAVGALAGATVAEMRSDNCARNS